MPLPLLFVIDLLLTGVLLVVFAYFHHVRPQKLQGEGVIIARQEEYTPVPVSTPEPSPEPLIIEETAEVVITVPEEEESVKPGLFREKFSDRFTDGEVITTAENGVYTYVSGNVNIRIDTCEMDTAEGKCTYYITDFYIADISCLKTALAQDSFGSALYEWLRDIASRNGAVVAVNGDFYGGRKYGVVIRNGVLYRSDRSNLDACAIYWNGEMETFGASEWDAETLIEKGAYQAWSFGPRLLDKNGEAVDVFNATAAVEERNPRTAIGYYEPGHYCFVTVDGYTAASRGLTLKQLSELMHSLGCEAAYNLDGGQSTALTFDSRIINRPYKDGRRITDAVMIIDSAAR